MVIEQVLITIDLEWGLASPRQPNCRFTPGSVTLSGQTDSKGTYPKCRHSMHLKRSGCDTELSSTHLRDCLLPTLSQARLGITPSAICVQDFDDSRDSAIHMTYRSLLRSSSTREPRDPLLKVVLVMF